MIVINNLKKLVVITLVLLYGTSNIMAQQDTLWYTDKWKVTTKKDASYFRPPIKKEGDLYRIQDFYKSGILQMNALSKYIDKDYWQGKVTWYNIDGSMQQEGNYNENKLHGEYISYISDKKIVSNYENGKYISGETNLNYGNYYVYLEEIENGYRRVYHKGDLKGIRYEEYLDKDKKKKGTKYYDKNGAFIGESKENGNGQKSGVIVYYSYNPFSLSSIQYYSKSSVFLGTSTYYKNGNLREEFIQNPEYKTIYYSVKGDVIGQLTYRMRNSYLSPKDGTKLVFNSNFKKEDINKETWPYSFTSYVNGEIVKYEEKYENKITKSLSTYVDNSKELDVFYDEKGKEIARLTYKNYKPYNGVEFNRDAKRIYKEGLLVEHVKYYPETKNKFMVLKEGVETYYDKQGKLLGTLKLDDYNSPLEGSKYTYYKGVYDRIEEYKNGKVVKVTTLRKGEGDVYHKKIEEFGIRGYDKIREISFYSNDKIQSNITYKNYKPITGIYFNKEGEQIGVYDYVLKEGVRYKFFSTSDQVEVMEEIKDGKQIRNLKYRKVYNSINKNYEYKVITDIDNSKDAKFYNKEGELIATATFKNGEIYQGKVYDDLDRSLYEIKEGKKNGIYKKYDYQDRVIESGNFKNNLREGLFINYNALGIKMSSVNYMDGKPEGDAIYYNEEGKVLSKMNYKNGKPYSGKITITNGYSENYKEETYTQGNITQTINTKKEEKIVTNFLDKKSKEVIKYNADGRIFLTYNLKNEKLEGRVLSYGEDGKIIRTGEFEDGKLIIGNVKIKDIYSTNDSYLLLKRTESEFTIEKYNNEGLVYKAFEKIEEGMRSEHIYKLDSKIEYIYPDDIE